jgi:hypothetical protein
MLGLNDYANSAWVVAKTELAFCDQAGAVWRQRDGCQGNGTQTMGESAKATDGQA